MVSLRNAHAHDEISPAGWRDPVHHFVDPDPLAWSPPVSLKNAIVLVFWCQQLISLTAID